MWKYPVDYDVIVVGGGHAGCEAALASARKGCRTLMLTISLDTIAKMSCNPAIGGTAKGHMVREIDALGGAMGQAIDRTGIQFRMLNRAKGPAVWAPRAQADKQLYHQYFKKLLEECDNLDLREGYVEELIIENNQVQGVTVREGVFFPGRAVILTAGTFMEGLCHIGEKHFSGGRAGCAASHGLSASLKRAGFSLGRLKTGTPPRLNRRTIDFSLTEEQKGDDDVRFSFSEPLAPRLPQVCCHITYTTEETHDIIRQNISRSPIFSGKIESIGPRYCPSIEDKVVRFRDKERHQIFLEPEGLNTEEIYANGVSSSLPFDVQHAFIRSIPALKNAHIMRPAYAIEYDYISAGQIKPSLETKKVQGLFLAGQVNGTTGYEEAAAQGLVAGINAAGSLLDQEPVVFSRSEAYIGVMIDDLITKAIDEPYRMFTSRAEHRLLLRQDNADLRLRRRGFAAGLVSKEDYATTCKKEKTVEEQCARLEKTFRQQGVHGYSMMQLLARPETSYSQLLEQYPEEIHDCGEAINFQIELFAKYAGYIRRQQSEVQRLSHIENILIPESLSYDPIVGLRTEAKQKLQRATPSNLGQASRISGVSPADISILMVHLSRH